jgi:hypothetical protein
MKAYGMYGLQKQRHALKKHKIPILENKVTIVELCIFESWQSVLSFERPNLEL